MKTFFSFFKKNRTVAALLVALQIPLFGNNVQVTNLTVVNPTTLQFDLSWENSWRVNYGTNFDSYDGAYLFFKYRASGGTTAFLPIVLASANPVSGLPAGFVAPAVPNCIGVFVYPSAATYSGSPSMVDVTANLASALPFNVDVRAFAVEMVYVAATAPCTSYNGFYIGDGNGIQEATSAFHIDNNNSAFISLNSGLVTVDIGNPLYYEDDFLTSTGIGIEEVCGTGLTWGASSNPFFPVGRAAFWAMKHEISQAGYRDFLNSLSLSQQAERVATNITGATGGVVGSPIFASLNRNYLELKTLGNTSDGLPASFGCDASGNDVWDEAADGEWVACNYLNYEDVHAWLDWAGMGFLSELEFEKLGRGLNQPAKFGEFAWGTNGLFSIPGNTYTPTNLSTASEAVNGSTTTGNANWFGAFPAYPNQGPLRNGVFGLSNSTRTTSGSSFYGAMELSGNVNEICFTIGNETSRSYGTRANGNGILNGSGRGDIFIPADFEMPKMFIFRGGNWGSNSEKLRVSDRSGGFPNIDAERSQYNGGRGAVHIY